MTKEELITQLQELPPGTVVYFQSTTANYPLQTLFYDEDTNRIVLSHRGWFVEDVFIEGPGFKSEEVLKIWDHATQKDKL